MATRRVPMIAASLAALAGAEGALYGAAFSYNVTTQNCTASLVKLDDASGTWADQFVFGELPYANLAGLLASDGGDKWWLAAGESSQTGTNALFYALEGNVTTLRTKVPLTTLEYASEEDEFLATWQSAGPLQQHHLSYGAVDPYLAT